MAKDQFQIERIKAETASDNKPKPFFGYDTEAHMRQFNPDIADELIKLANLSEARQPTEGRKCVGSIDGIDFLYEEGPNDQGKVIKVFRAEKDGNIFKWGE